MTVKRQGPIASTQTCLLLGGLLLAAPTNMIILNLKLILLSISTHNNANADINVLTASFTHSWTDLTIRRDRRDFKIRRNYNSRRINNGLFGFGWCSDLDIHLNLENQSLIELDKCDGHNPLQFIESTIEPNTYYLNNSIGSPNDSEKIVKNKNGYSRTVSGRIVQKFNSSGHLIFSNNDGELAFSVKYSSDKRISEIAIQKGGSLTIKLNSDGQIADIEDSNGHQTKYRYIQSDLKSVHKPLSKNNTYEIQYNYDNHHNLTNIVYPDKKQESIDYDELLDRVISHRSKDSCLKKISYHQNDKSKLRFTTSIEKSCRSEKPTSHTYEFYYRKSSTGALYLDNATTTEQKGNSRIFLDISKQKGHANENGET